MRLHAAVAPLEARAWSRSVEQVSGVEEAGGNDSEAAPEHPVGQDGARADTPWPQGMTFGRADKVCMTLFVALGLFSLAMLPLRPVILAMEPLALVALTGSRTGMVASGALAAVGQASWPLALAVGTLSIVKFDLVYWWAGRLWGDWFIASLVGTSKGARKRAKRAEAVARRYAFWAIALTYLPVPIPSAIIYAVLGTAGMSLRRFLVIDLLWAFVVQSGYLYLGYRIGEPAVALLEEYARYSWYLAIAIIVVIVVGSIRAARARNRKSAARGDFTS